MTTDTAKQIADLARLRAPFSKEQISTMCRSTKKDNAKGTCPKCKGYHGLPAIQLDYVGHAALTDRLLDVDPLWYWTPCARGPDGGPVVDKDGGFWIELTVCGVTRLGYGDAQGKTGGDAMKERIGDALRNAAMRFGCALDLWHKGDLHPEGWAPGDPPAPTAPVTPKTSSSAPVGHKDRGPVTPASASVTATQGKPEPKAVAADLAAISNAKGKPQRFAALMAAQKKYPEGTPERKAAQDLYAALSKEKKEPTGPRFSDVPQDPRDEDADYNQSQMDNPSGKG